jgi:hypothetical protein
LGLKGQKQVGFHPQVWSFQTRVMDGDGMDGVGMRLVYLTVRDSGEWGRVVS